MHLPIDSFYFDSLELELSSEIGKNALSTPVMPKRRPLPPLRSLSSGALTHGYKTLEELPCLRPDCTTVREEPDSGTIA